MNKNGNNHEEKAMVLVYQGKDRFFAPENTLSPGEIVIRLESQKNIDPLGIYSFVIDKHGEVQSCAKSCLKRIDGTVIRIPYIELQTYTQDMRRMHEAAYNYLIEEWYGGNKPKKS
jgi:hypothetical protein